MKIFLIVYGILAFLSFVFFTLAGEVYAKDVNSQLKYDLIQMSIVRLALMGLCFPIVWTKFIISIIVNRE